VLLFFKLTGVIFHLVGALTYLIVVAFAVALACTNSRGPATAARAGVVVAVLAAPNITDQGASILLEAPDHIGTSVFLLGSFILIDRAPGWRFTPPLLAEILVAGQIGDATVLYVAVPAVLLVSAYRKPADLVPVATGQGRRPVPLQPGQGQGVGPTLRIKRIVPASVLSVAMATQFRATAPELAAMVGDPACIRGKAPQGITVAD
jgi:hypothetical protein